MLAAIDPNLPPPTPPRPLGRKLYTPDLYPLDDEDIVSLGLPIDISERIVWK